MGPKSYYRDKGPFYHHFCTKPDVLQSLLVSLLSNIPLFRKAYEQGEKGEYKAESTLSPCLHVKPLITVIRAIYVGKC